MRAKRARDAEGKLIQPDTWRLRMFDMGGTSDSDCLRGLADFLEEEIEGGRRCHLISVGPSDPWVDEEGNDLDGACVSVIIRYCGPECACRRTT